MMDTVRAFRQVIEQAGLTAPETIIADGDLHRFASNGDRADDAGWYVLHGDGLPAGSFGCFRSNLTQKWCGKSEKVFTQQERLEHRKRIEAMQRQRDAEERRRHAEAATRAQTIWEQAAPATADHPYLNRKQVHPHGLRVDADNNLILPVLSGGSMSSLQYIPPTERQRKMFLAGGAVRGGNFTFGDLTDATTVLICEGFATGASLFEATGSPVVCALFAGNLLPVAQSHRQQFPSAVIVLAGDNDIRTDGTPNTGLEAATAAAEAIGGVLVMPDLDGRKCDWNDVYVQRGLDAVHEAIEAAIRREEMRTMNTATGDMAEADTCGAHPKGTSDLSTALVNYTDLLSLEIPTRPRYLPWLPEGGNVMAYGPRGVGKTFFGLGLAVALTTGGAY